MNAAATSEALDGAAQHDVEAQEMTEQLAAMGLPSSFGSERVKKRRSGSKHSKAAAAADNANDNAAAAADNNADSVAGAAPKLRRALCPSGGEQAQWHYLDLQVRVHFSD